MESKRNLMHYIWAWIILTCHLAVSRQVTRSLLWYSIELRSLASKESPWADFCSCNSIRNTDSILHIYDKISLTHLKYWELHVWLHLEKDQWSFFMCVAASRRELWSKWWLKNHNLIAWGKSSTIETKIQSLM